MALSYDQAADILIAAGQRLDGRGLAPATSGNFSVRLDERRIAVTVSGRHKGRLTRDDVMLVSPDGIPLEKKKPSAETGLHILRLVVGGVFDAFPKLQYVIGHCGEALPFMMQRFDERFPQSLTKLQRPVSAYLRENVNYTIAGFNFPATFLDLLLEVGADRIMFSADYPYNTMEAARAFLDQIPVSADDRERIAHGNAEKLFKL